MFSPIIYSCPSKSSRISPDSRLSLGDINYEIEKNNCMAIWLSKDSKPRGLGLDLKLTSISSVLVDLTF